MNSIRRMVGNKKCANSKAKPRQLIVRKWLGRETISRREMTAVTAHARLNAAIMCPAARREYPAVAVHPPIRDLIRNHLRQLQTSAYISSTSS